MKVGMTYDLREEYLSMGFSPEETAEFDSMETVRAIENVLLEMGHQVERIGHIRQLAAKLVAGKRWDIVFNIAEGLFGAARESQVPALLDAYQIPYTFSNPSALAVSLDKALAKRIVRDHGVDTAPFQVIKTLADLEQLQLSFPIFAKPIGEGTSKGVTAKSCNMDISGLRQVCSDLLQKFKQPVLLEQYLPGREFTVGIVGNGKEAEVAGVMEVKLGKEAEEGAYTFDNKEHYEGKVEYQLVDDLEAKLAATAALRAWSALSCFDAGRIDFRSNRLGIPQFLEINPIAGLHPIRSDLIIIFKMKGFSYEACIRRIFNSSLKRLKFPESEVVNENHCVA